MLYGTVLLMAHQGKDSNLAKALGKDAKGIASVVIYAVAIPLSFVDSRIACGLYVLVAVIGFIPDRRIERAIAE